MKKNIFLVLFLFILFTAPGLSCGSSSKPEKSKELPKVVKASSDIPPKWVIKTPSGGKFMYFVGTASANNINDAKKLSSSDAVKQLIEYIGFRATAVMKRKTKMEDTDSVSTFRQEVEEKVQGKGSANVSVEVEDIYYEVYSDNSYTLYTLIKCPVSWIEKERERLKAQVDEQRKSAVNYLKQSEKSAAAGNLSRSIDLLLQALEISGRAEENSDIYDEAKAQLVLIMSSLTFKLENSPQFAFEEGGSEPVNIGVYSSKAKGLIDGIMLEGWEKNGKAELAGKNGTISDKDGKVYYEVVTNKGADKIEIVVSFSLKKFESYQESDEDLYQKLKSMQQNQSLYLTLLVRSGLKIVPSCIVAYNVYENRLRPMEKLRQALSVKMVENKYNIVAVDIPAAVMPDSRDEGVIQERIIGYIKEKYPDIKRIYFGFGISNPSSSVDVGKIVGIFNRAVGRALEGQNMQGMELRFTLSIIDIKTMKVHSGQNIKTSATGMNADQALASAEDEVLKKIEIK